MKLSFVALTVFLLSCYTVKITPLKGKYFEPPFIIVTQTSKEMVWDKLIDLFAQKGLSIKIIDKSSGLIISEETKLSWTNETKEGELYNKTAFIAVPLRAVKKPTPQYLTITGEWNVRIKLNDEGKTAINVNIVNMRELVYYNSIPSSTPLTGARSTGVFEQIIVDYIK